MGVRSRRLLPAVAALLMLTGDRSPADPATWPGPKGPWIDEAHLKEVHKARIARLGEDGPRFESAWWLPLEHLLWPTEAELAGALNDPDRTAGARASCARELGWILRPEFVPENIAESLVALRKYGRNDSDFLLARGQVGHWKIQVIYSGHRTGILALQIGPVAPGQPTAEHALKVAKELFVPPRPQDEPLLKARAGLNSGIAHGGISNPNTQSRADPLRGPGPWYAAGFITNGQYVFLVPSKWHLGDGDIRSDLAGLPRAPRADEPVLLFD